MQRFLAPVDLLELHSDGFPVVCDDDFLCLSIVTGPLTFTVTILEGRERYNDHRGLPDLGNELDPEPSTSETGIDISLEVQYPPQVLENAQIPVSLRVNTSLICEMYS
ncbi:hypothetical protein OUZ56_016979 [Daphnia magna]|uniref:Uncharacterized protein n=1 Tax=Daphnia magna TaxID=35525 RepID=A0ABR0ASA2_9CRUS|nr:hypothetical protein OUZ56_016979 [Daphnia magna]